MRQLTQQEINDAPDWATEYNIDRDDDIFWLSSEYVQMKSCARVNRVNVTGYFDCIKPIPRKEFDIGPYIFLHQADGWSAQEEEIEIARHKAIEIAKHFKLTGSDLK